MSKLLEKAMAKCFHVHDIVVHELIIPPPISLEGTPTLHALMQE
jgi:hypothetical protein